MRAQPSRRTAPQRKALVFSNFWPYPRTGTATCLWCRVADTTSTNRHFGTGFRQEITFFCRLWWVFLSSDMVPALLCGYFDPRSLNLVQNVSLPQSWKENVYQEWPVQPNSAKELHKRLIWLFHVYNHTCPTINLQNNPIWNRRHLGLSCQ